VQLLKLAEYNQLSENSRVKTGTIIRLRPGAAILPKPAAALLHQVQPKEGLYSIAKKYNITVEDIKEWNQLAADDLKTGQQLIIAK
jgi:hypothetical protein